MSAPSTTNDVKYPKGTYHLTGGFKLPDELTTPTAPKVCQIMAVLLVNAGKIVTSSQLIEELWGERPPESVSTTMQTYIYKLRHYLGDTGRNPGEGRQKDLFLLRTAGVGYRLHVDPAQVDVLAFARKAKGLEISGNESNEKVGEVLAALDSAFDHLRGPILPEVHHGVMLQAFTDLFAEQYREAKRQRIRANLCLGRLHPLLSDLMEARLEDPSNEDIARYRMVVLYCAGRRAEALDVYRRLYATFDNAIGLAPHPLTQEVQMRILKGDGELFTNPCRFI